jgi:hypothetical protein
MANLLLMKYKKRDALTRHYKENSHKKGVIKIILITPYLLFEVLLKDPYIIYKHSLR